MSSPPLCARVQETETPALLGCCAGCPAFRTATLSSRGEGSLSISLSLINLTPSFSSLSYLTPLSPLFPISLNPSFSFSFSLPLPPSPPSLGGQHPRRLESGLLSWGTRCPPCSGQSRSRLCLRVIVSIAPKQPDLDSKFLESLTASPTPYNSQESCVARLGLAQGHQGQTAKRGAV